ncbi:MAG: DNA polymerase ligase N-terminal domain-containing protein [Planctomycetaceae bacterium]
MPRFVILTHDYPHLHWDFMLEWEGTLRTWRLEKEPSLDCAIRAEPLPDHRLEYLEYEGPVSGDRGTVTRWDVGTYTLWQDSAAAIDVYLIGQKLYGRAAVTLPELSDHATFRYSGDPTAPDWRQRQLTP